jgi:hypothetical protein
MRDLIRDGYHGEERDPLRPTSRAWLGGGPPHLSFADVRRDLAAYRRLRCPCGATGPRLTPQHTSDGRYRVLAECRACGASETL